MSILDDGGGLLTRDLLGELWEALAAAGAPVLEHVQPGVSTEAIEEAMAPVGLRLPDEAFIWWTWQNGTNAFDYDPAYYVVPQQGLISLDAAIQQRDLSDRINHQVGEEVRALGRGEFDEQWQPSWFPILRTGRSLIVCDCDVPPHDPTPLHHVAYGDVMPAESRVIQASSMGAMVRMWIRALHDGLWQLDPDTRRWSDDYWDAMPFEWKLTGFM